MKFKEFKKKMQKGIFSVEEAKRVAWNNSAQTLRLQFHQWNTAGDLVRLKRGLYGFSDQIKDQVEIARALYTPAYISLESALHHHGILPDVTFGLSLVTPRGTRSFKTPVGQFLYYQIKQNLFWGYDPKTLMAEPEKALLDYFYLKGVGLYPKIDFWETLRVQNLQELNFKKAKGYAKQFNIKKITELLLSLESYRYGKTKKSR